MEVDFSPETDVPYGEIMRREAEYKGQSLANPNRRCPKRKAKR